MKANATLKHEFVEFIPEDLEQGTLYIATTGPAYPVAIVKEGTDSGKITFDEWNKPVTLTAPSNSVDLSQLEGG